MILGLAATLTSGCQTIARPGSDPFAWQGSSDPLKLTYEEDATDNVGLWLTCDPAFGVVTFGSISEESASGRAYGERWITESRLRSGAASGRYRAQAEIGDAGAMVEAKAAASDPVLAAFAKSGMIAIDGAEQNAETPEERSAIRAFLTACRA